MDGTTTLGTVTLSGGTASYSTAKLATGSDSITATYNGSARLHDEQCQPDPDRQPGRHHGERHLVAESLDLRPVGDLHGDRDGQRAGERDADGDRHVLRRHDGDRHGHAQRRQGDLEDPCAAGRLARDHRGLRRRYQLRHKHVRGPDPDGQPGCDDDQELLVAQSFGLRPVGDVHGDASRPHRRGAGRRRGPSSSSMARPPWAADAERRGRRRSRRPRSRWAPHAITAVYGGDPNFTTSTSAALTQTVNQDEDGDETDFVGQSLDVRPVGDVHGDGQRDVPGERDPDRDGHVLERLNDARQRERERRDRDLHHLLAVGRDSFHQGHLWRRREFQDQHVGNPEPGRPDYGWRRHGRDGCKRVDGEPGRVSG